MSDLIKRWNDAWASLNEDDILWIKDFANNRCPYVKALYDLDDYIILNQLEINEAVIIRLVDVIFNLKVAREKSQSKDAD